MPNKISRKIIALLITIALCLLFLPLMWGRFSQYEPPTITSADTPPAAYLASGSHPTLIGDDQPISRGMAAKMLSLIHLEPSTIHSLEITHPFVDIPPNHWYAPYVNAAYSTGIMRGSGERFTPDTFLTVGQAQILMRNLDPANSPTFANISDPNQPISYALWVELYKQLLESLSGSHTIFEAFGIRAIDIIVLATSINSPLPEGHLISDIGPLGHRGLNMDAYVDTQVRVLVRDREIIALITLVSHEPTLKNAYIVAAGQNEITLFVGGAERTFSATGVNIQQGVIADVVIHRGQALSVQTFSDTVEGILLRASNSAVEIKGKGLFPLKPNFNVYDISEGTVRWRNMTNLIVGTDTARFYLRDGFAAAGVITHQAFPENIRVVIGTSNFAGLIHTSVTVTSTGPFWITDGSADSERLMELAPGQRFTISDIENTDLMGHPRIFLHTNPDEKLQLTGLNRNWPQGGSPRYRGVIEIAREQVGYSVVNSLPLEKYLYAVVPSEMPSSFGVESSKVQAVTARSYAVHQIMANRFHALGGNIDDSVMSQVYNNIPENEISIEAVDATRGLVLWYGNDVVRANFFATSAGMTANSGEVWASGRQFPGNTPTFLQARPQFTGQAIEMFDDLSDEAQATAFFRNRDIEAYDSHANWFRWQIEMTPEEITASVNAHIEARFTANPTLIRTMGNDGQWHSTPISTIGNFRSMQVVRRGQAGNIMELRLTGDQADVLVLTEFNIRSLLRPAQLNNAIMPSAFFTFEKIINAYGLTERIIFHGGGHGHGVGMSQNGVFGMVERGYSFDEILRHFYPGTELLTLQAVLLQPNDN